MQFSTSRSPIRVADPFAPPARPPSQPPKHPALRAAQRAAIGCTTSGPRHPKETSNHIPEGVFPNEHVTCSQIQATKPQFILPTPPTPADNPFRLPALYGASFFPTESDS